MIEGEFKYLKIWSHPPGLNRRPADYESVGQHFARLLAIDMYLYYQ